MKRVKLNHMQRNKSKMVSPKRRLYIKIVGLVMFMAGMMLLGALLLSHGSLAFILLAGVLTLLGLVFVISPEVLAIVIETILWLP